MYKITRMGRIPGVDHQLDARIEWVRQLIIASDDEETDVDALPLSEEELTRLAADGFEYDPADAAEAAAAYGLELATEVWRPIEDYEGRYQVSNLGRVRSLERLVKRRGAGDIRVRGRILKPTASDARLRVGLSKNGEQRTHYIGRLVLETYVSPPPEGFIARFKDGDRTNLRLSNLRWGHASEAAQEAAATRRQRTEAVPVAAEPAPAAAPVADLREGSVSGVSWKVGRRASGV